MNVTNVNVCEYGRMRMSANANVGECECLVNVANVREWANVKNVPNVR